jgi:hypothetical protein
MKQTPNWLDLGPNHQRRYIAQAKHLIEKCYPVPEKDVYKLAEILYNRASAK